MIVSCLLLRVSCNSDETEWMNFIKFSEHGADNIITDISLQTVLSKLDTKTFELLLMQSKCIYYKSSALNICLRQILKFCMCWVFFLGLPFILVTYFQFLSVWPCVFASFSLTHNYIVCGFFLLFI